MTVSPQRTTPYPPIGFSSQLQPVPDSGSACPELIDSITGGGNVSLRANDDETPDPREFRLEGAEG